MAFMPPNAANLSVLATRKPMLSFRLAGSLLFRFAERTFLGSLFQLPPRRTRFEPPLIRRDAV